MPPSKFPTAAPANEPLLPPQTQALLDPLSGAPDPGFYTWVNGLEPKKAGIYLQSRQRKLDFYKNCKGDDSVTMGEKHIFCHGPRACLFKEAWQQLGLEELVEEDFLNPGFHYFLNVLIKYLQMEIDALEQLIETGQAEAPIVEPEEPPTVGAYVEPAESDEDCNDEDSFVDPQPTVVVPRPLPQAQLPPLPSGISVTQQRVQASIPQPALPLSPAVMLPRDLRQEAVDGCAELKNNFTEDGLSSRVFAFDEKATKLVFKPKQEAVASLERQAKEGFFKGLLMKGQISKARAEMKQAEKWLNRCNIGMAKQRSKMLTIVARIESLIDALPASGANNYDVDLVLSEIYSARKKLPKIKTELASMLEAHEMELKQLEVYLVRSHGTSSLSRTAQNAKVQAIVTGQNS